MDTATGPSKPQTTDDVRALTVPQRLRRIDQARVFYPRWHTVHAEIAQVHDWRRLVGIPAEPCCLLLVGPTGVGKSKLVESYAQAYPPHVTADTHGERTLHPVMRATIPTPATVKSLAVTLLVALGDPRPTTGTVVTMTERLVRYITDCQVELLILDELQHFVDRNSHRVLEDASNWLKLLLKTTGVSCVLVGLQYEAEVLLRANPQLGRLFGDPYVLDPFTWDEERPETIAEFRQVLAAIERLMPLAEPSHLAAPVLARRLFVASGGTMGLLMALIRRATQLAIDQGCEHLDADLLGTAFAYRLAGVRRGIANPFLTTPSSGTTTRDHAARSVQAAP